MITSNGKRVFAQVDNDLICYNFDERNKTWNEYGAHYSTSSIKDGKVVISNENDSGSSRIFSYRNKLQQ